MSKKIYHVQVVTDLCVLADDEREATVLARSHAREEDPVISSIKLVETVDEIPKGWSNCLPWGTKGSKTDTVFDHVSGKK